MQRLGQIAQHMGHHTRHGMMVAAAATVGSQVPAIELDLGFPPAGGETVNLADRCAGKKILLLGLPGAFTPC